MATEPVDRSSESLRVLIAELDAKLSSTRMAVRTASTGAPELGRSPIRWGRVWMGYVGLMLLIASATLVAVSPSRCTLGEDLCRVQTLDVDALRIALPDSRLVQLLPDIDTLDPDDELTVGDVVELDRFAGRAIDDLLTPEEIEVLLAYLE